MAEKLYSYADKQVMDEVGSGGGGGGGGSSSTLFIHASENEDGDEVFDKTWRQIYDHIVSGGRAVVIYADIPEDGAYNMTAIVDSTGHFVSDDYDSYYSIGVGGGQYKTDSEDGYPVR